MSEPVDRPTTHRPGPPDGEPLPLTPTPGDDRILTIPNVITLGRLLVLPVFLWLLFSAENRVAAAVVLGVLGATDFVDGYLARHLNQTSRLGKLFDPTADRILFFVAITAILIDGSAPAWLCIVVLAREAVVATITVTLLAIGAPPVDVTWWGKAGTFMLMVAFPLFLGGADPDLAIADAVTIAAWMAAIPGLVLSFVAAFSYIPLWGEALRERRVLRSATGS